MVVNVILSDEEKQTLNEAIAIICAYKNHTTESGAEFVRTLETINHLTEFLNKVNKIS